MFDAILGIMSSGGLGAILGGVFGWLGKKEARKAKNDEFAHEAVMMGYEVQESANDRTHALDMADKAVVQTNAEGEIAIEVGEVAAFTESMKVQAMKTGMPIIDGIRFLMRPVITMYLLAVMSYVTYNINELLGGLTSLPLTDLIALYQHIIHQGVFLTITAVTWWFASRDKGPGLK